MTAFLKRTTSAAGKIYRDNLLQLLTYYALYNIKYKQYLIKEYVVLVSSRANSSLKFSKIISTLTI
jgi:hypothetical protein